MEKGGDCLSTFIKDNSELMLKLSATNMMLVAIQLKVNNYLKKNEAILQEMKEDEEAMQLFNLYYEENEEELTHSAQESVITSHEVEEILSKMENTKIWD